MYHVSSQATWEIMATSGSCIYRVGYQTPLTNLNIQTSIIHNIHSEISFTTSTTKLLDLRSAHALLQSQYLSSPTSSTLKFSTYIHIN